MDLPIKIPRVFANKHWHACHISWLRSVYSRSRSRDSIYFYNRTIARFFCDTKRNPNAYTRQDVESFITAGNVSPATRNHRLAVLTSFFKHAQQFLAPFRGVMRPVLHAGPPTIGIPNSLAEIADRDIEEAEVIRLFAAIPRDTLDGKRDRALIMCYLSTARRRKEIADLVWSDIQEAVFDGNRPGWKYTFKAKGRTKKDVSELPKDAFAAIREYLEADGRWGKMQPNSPVFRGKLLSHTISRHTVTMIFKRYARAAGLPESVCLHSLRHYAAWDMYQVNHDIVAVSEFLGHSNIDQTLRYIKRRTDRMRGNPVANSLSQKYSSW